MQTAILDGFRAMEEGIYSPEAKINTHLRVKGSNGSEMMPPSSARKRKIAHHPDLSVTNIAE